MEKNNHVMSDMVAVPIPTQSLKPTKIISREQEVVLEIPRERVEKFFQNPARNTERRPKIGVWVVGIGCALALAITFGGFFAHATVTIVPKSFSKTVDVSGNLAIATATHTFSESVIIPSTGTIGASSFATGKVRLYNTGTTSVTVPAKTILVASSGKRYQLDKSVTIPKKTKTPGQADGQIQAVEEGAGSNGDPDDFTLEKPLSQNTVTIRSLGPITGGALAGDPIADVSAIAGATNQVLARFSDGSLFIKRMSADIPDDVIVLPLSLPQSTPRITVVGNQVVGTQTVMLVLAHKTDLGRFLAKSVGAPEGLQLATQSFDGMTMVTNTILEKNTRTLQLRITGTPTLVGVIDQGMITQKIRGVSRSQAGDFLKTIPEILSSSISMRPFWRRTIPQSVDII